MTDIVGCHRYAVAIDKLKSKTIYQDDVLVYIYTNDALYHVGMLALMRNSRMRPKLSNSLLDLSIKMKDESHKCSHAHAEPGCSSYSLLPLFRERALHRAPANI